MDIPQWAERDMMNLTATKRIRPTKKVAWIPGFQVVLPDSEWSPSESPETMHQDQSGRVGRFWQLYC